jgi:carboxypeptidase PM20D1
VNRRKVFLKRTAQWLLVSLIFLVAILLYRTTKFTSRQLKSDVFTSFSINKDALDHLSGALKFETVSMSEGQNCDTLAFIQFQRFLSKSYPLVHSQLKLEKINKFSLLYSWKGTNPSLKPILLMAHQDVVPVSPNTLKEWKHQPFQGKITERFVYGRGTLDVKTGIIAQLEAIEILLKKGYKPKRTILLAYGHDEEIGGKNGAMQIARHLKSKNISLHYVLDEGGSIVDGVVPGVKKPVALVGIAEKGYVSLQLSVRSKGGHSSMPPKQTSIGILCRAIDQLENNPFPYKIDGLGALMFDYVGPEMNYGMRLVFANRWLFNPLIKKKLDASDATRATMHTTMAATIFQSGNKDNVLPIKAVAQLNFRILPGESVHSTKEYVQKVINDPRVHIDILDEFSFEPSMISDTSSNEFRTIQKTVSEVFPNVIFAPYLVLGATDSKHYRHLTKNCYRFIPIRLTNDDLSRIHGTNERILISSYYDCIRFYHQLLLNSTGETRRNAH